jgi:hypothetical protein
VLHNKREEKHVWDEQTSLKGRFISYEENEVL